MSQCEAMDEYWSIGVLDLGEDSGDANLALSLCVGRGDVVQQEGGIGTALGIHYSDSVNY